MASSDIPVREPVDGITASAADLREMARWVSEAFCAAVPGDAGKGAAAPLAAGAQPRVQLRRQDYASLEFGQSCMGL